jgi:hypothetical protein
MRCAARPSPPARNAARIGLPQERATRPFRKAQRSLSRLVVNHEQTIDLAKRANRAAFAFGLSPRYTPHERGAPAVRRRVADRAKERRVGG